MRRVFQTIVAFLTLGLAGACILAAALAVGLRLPRPVAHRVTAAAWRVLALAQRQAAALYGTGKRM